MNCYSIKAISPMISFNNLTFVLLMSFVCSFAEQKSKSHVEAELISEVNYIKPGEAFWVAVKLKMEHEWHTYWRNAGDAGLPTTISWELPEGFKHGEIQWQYPKLFIVEGLANFGYDGEVLLLVKITPSHDLQTETEVVLKARVNWLECKSACIPGSEDINLTLPVRNKTSENENWVSRFIETRKKLPVKAKSFSFKSKLLEESVTISAYNNNQSETGKINNARFFPYKSSIYNNSADQSFLQKDNGFSLEILFDDFKIETPKILEGIILLESEIEGQKSKKAIEITSKLTN